MILGVTNWIATDNENVYGNPDGNPDGNRLDTHKETHMSPPWKPVRKPNGNPPKHPMDTLVDTRWKPNGNPHKCATTHDVCRYKIADEIIDEEKNRKRDKKRNVDIGLLEQNATTTNTTNNN